MKFKKYYPFIFPTIALLLVLFLAFRWYNLRTKREQEQEQAQEQVQIENLTEQEMEEIVKGTEDMNTVDMAGEATASGQIRYDVNNDQVVFSVTANLAQVKQGGYQAWIKRSDAQQLDKAFQLKYGKAGYSGSASVSSQYLPFEVVISRELNLQDDALEQEVLRGTVSAQGK